MEDEGQREGRTEGNKPKVRRERNGLNLLELAQKSEVIAIQETPHLSIRTRRY